MTNVYLLGIENDSNGELHLNTTLQFILKVEYGVTDEIRFITGNLIDDAGFIADRLQKEPNAWLILITDEKFIIFPPEKRDNEIEILSKYSGEKASDVILSGKI